MYAKLKSENRNIMSNVKTTFNHHISYPDIPELINELRLYGYTTTQGGTVRYGAPEGYHDDCVIALALAAWQLHKPRGRIII